MIYLFCAWCTNFNVLSAVPKNVFSLSDRVGAHSVEHYEMGPFGPKAKPQIMQL